MQDAGPTWPALCWTLYARGGWAALYPEPCTLNPGGWAALLLHIPPLTGSNILMHAVLEHEGVFDPETLEELLDRRRR